MPADNPTDTPCREYQFQHGDCFDVLPSLNEQSADAIVTSPPYNLGIAYGTYKDQRTEEDYVNWLRNFAGLCRRVLKPEGSLFLNIGGSPKQPLLPHRIAIELSEVLVLQNTFHWIKSITVRRPGEDEFSVGHFKPLNSPRYVTDCHEYVFHFTPKGETPLNRRRAGVAYEYKSNIARWKHTGGEDKRCRGNAWFVPYQTIQSRDKERPHPASFPAELAERCLLLQDVGAESFVIDPFNGIGHSAIAAWNLGVGRYLGIDIDENYLATARERLEELQHAPRQGELF